MSKKTSQIILLALLTTSSVEAKNHMLIMGGGGEGDKKATIFDNSIESFGKIAGRKGWDVSMAFNGGHEATEQLMDKHIPSTTKRYPDFTKASFDKILNDTIEKVKKGEIKAGETLYMFMYTHGAESTPDQTSHNIALTATKAITNYTSLEGLDLVSMDKLEELMLLTKEKGILLGITDMSCFGGNTLKLKEKLKLDNVCITSSAGKDTPALASKLSFGERFLKEVAKGGVLEDVFLKTRDNTIIGDYPLISSDVGEELQDRMREIMRPYISADMTGIMLTSVTDYTMKVAGDAGLQCRREQNFETLIKEIEKLKKSVSPIRFIKQKKLEALIEMLKDYKELQDSYVRAFAGLKSEYLNEEVEFTTQLISPITHKNDSLKYKRREFYDMDLAYMRKQITSKLPEAKSIDDEFRLKRYDEIEIFRNDLISKDPNFEQYKNSKAKVLQTELDQLTNSLAVSFFEKDFYNLEYKRMRKEKKKTKQLNKEDACRKIRF